MPSGESSPRFVSCAPRRPATGCDPRGTPSGNPPAADIDKTQVIPAVRVVEVPEIVEVASGPPARYEHPPGSRASRKPPEPRSPAGRRRSGIRHRTIAAARGVRRPSRTEAELGGRRLRGRHDGIGHRPRPRLGTRGNQAAGRRAVVGARATHRPSFRTDRRRARAPRPTAPAIPWAGRLTSPRRSPRCSRASCRPSTTWAGSWFKPRTGATECRASCTRWPRPRPRQPASSTTKSTCCGCTLIRRVTGCWTSIRTSIPRCLLNCLLMAATEGIVTGDLLSANYHFVLVPEARRAATSKWASKPSAQTCAKL